MLLFAPLLRGGNRQIALTILLGMGLLLFALLLAQRSFHLLPLKRVEGESVPPSTPAYGSPWFWAMVALLVSSPLWLGALHLIPIDSAAWGQLAGREHYLPALQAAGLPVPPTLPLSLAPSGTWVSMWAGVPVAAAFLTVLLLPATAIDKLLGVLLFTGLVQIVISVMQFAQGADSALYFGTNFPGQRFIGTFNNRNHLADLLAMLVPVWFYFLVRQQKQDESGHSRATGLAMAASKPLWLLFGFSLVVLILSAQSRGGLIAASVVLVLSTLLYLASVRRQLNGWQKLGILALLGLFALVALVAVGVEGIASRLERQVLDRDTETRSAMSAAAFDAARQYWPWGSGMGSFAEVFPRFQGIDIPGHVTHAHNDYPQLAMELGAAGVGLALMLLAAVIFQAVVLAQSALRTGRMSAPIALRSLCGIGALALVLHSWVEFNIHIPALAITAACLTAIYLRPLGSE